MPNTKDNKTRETPAILVIGDGGTEKTRFLAGCPKPYIYDFDAGTASLSDFEVEYDTFKDAPWRASGKDASLATLGIYPWGTSWPKFYNHLNDKWWPYIEKGEPLPFSTLGLDSLTTLATQSMNYVLKSNNKTAEAIIDQGLWGQQLRLLETVMEQLAAWPIRLVVNAHIKRDTNLVTQETEYLPMVAGQLAGRIGIYFDEVYYTKVEGSGDNRKVVFITQSDSLYRQAKSRHKVPNKTLAKWSAIEPYFAKKAS